MNAPRRFAQYDPEICLNCGADLDVDDQYCRDCGQRNRRHARSIIAWIAEGLSSLFHLEGKLLNTLRDLPKPGRYAYNYLNGQRQRYVHPLRLLLFSSLVCFASMSGIGWLSTNLENGFQPTSDEYATYEQRYPEARFGAADTTLYASPEAVAQRRSAQRRAADLERAADSVRAARDQLLTAGVDLAAGEGAEEEFDKAVEELEDQIDDYGDRAEDLVEIPEHPAYARMRNVDQLRADLVAHDRVSLLALDLAAGGYAQTAETRFLLDTLVATFPMPTSQFSGADETDDSGFNLFEERLVVEPRLLAVGDPQRIVDSMHLEHPANRLVAPKIIALYQDGVENATSYLVSNISWAVLLFVPMIAFGYYLFYWRRMPFYAQNLAYAAILLSVTLLAFTIGVGAHAIGLGSIAWPVLALALYAYMILGEAHLYDVAWWKALLKNSAIGVYGTIAFCFSVVLWLMLAVLFV